MTNTGSKRIFVVEDDDGVRSSTGLLLEALGYCVLEFASAEALLDAGNFADADCLVLDHNLPGMSGLDLLLLLRKRDAMAPAIIISADALRLRSPGLGIVAILRKPLSADALAQWLEQIFREG